MSSVLRAMSLSVALRLIRLLLNMALIGVLGRYLGVAGMGKVITAQAVVTMLLCVAELGLARITVRELIRNAGQEREILGATFWARLAVGGVLFLGVIAAGFLPFWDAQERMLLWLCGLLLPTHCLAELGSWMEARHRVADVWKAQTAGFLCGAAVLAGGVFGGAPLVFFPLPYLVECWVAAALLWRRFRRAGLGFSALRWRFPRAVALVRESFPEMLSQLGLMMLFRVDTLMVKAICGAGAAGGYGVAVRLSEVLYFIPAALAGLMLPRLLSRQQSNPREYRAGFADYFGATWLLAAAGAAALSLLAAPLVNGLMGEGFEDSAAILSVHAWAFVPYALGIVRTQHLTAEGRLSSNLPSVFLALVVNVGLNLAWIPKWQGLGAAWATLAAYAVAWLGTSILLPSLRDTARLQFGSLSRLPALACRAVDAVLGRRHLSGSGS